MVGGFNTNVRYRGRVFHIQTENSGPSTARVVVTLVYEGGVILSSKKTRYDAKADAAESQRVVRELMETQHGDVARALKGGELDTEIGLRAPAAKSPAAASSAAQAAGQNGTGHTGSPVAKPAEVAATVDRFGQGLISEASLDRVVLAHLGIL
jgi:hypothetical protein